MIKNFFARLNEEKDLEKRFFRYASYITTVLSFLALLVNLIAGLGLDITILSFSYILLSSLSFYYSKYDKYYNSVKIFFFTGSISLLDIGYFLSGGLDSSITYAFIITFLAISIILKKKTSQIISFFLFIINLLVLFYLEKEHPEWITPYKDINTKYSDLIGSLVVISIFISLTITFFKSTYEELLTNIALKNKALIEEEHKTRIEKEKAEHASNAKKDFLSVMSHEIRTPLNAIISVAHLLEQSDDKKDAVLFKTLKYSSQNLLALVSDILDLSKIESGEIKLELTEFDIKELLESIVLVHNIKAKERGNELSFKLENFTNLKFLGDPLRLTQILVNLVSNAIKFTKDGLITIKVIQIKEINDKNLSELYFEVKDTGIGIPKENHNYIFEKFTQENVAITRKYGGSGLGLSITKNLIEIMNSEIKLESEVGAGAKFYFNLELEKSVKSIVEKTKPKVEINLSEIKILFVEDNKVNIMLTSKFLDKWKFQYTVAENGLIALEKYKELKFDIILMDLQMPEMDGFTATQEIRKLDTKIPIVALTANSLADERERCLNSGFDDYLTKPFKPDTLKEKIISFAQK